MKLKIRAVGIRMSPAYGKTVRMQPRKMLLGPGHFEPLRSDLGRICPMVDLRFCLGRRPRGLGGDSRRARREATFKLNLGPLQKEILGPWGVHQLRGPFWESVLGGARNITSDIHLFLDLGPFVGGKDCFPVCFRGYIGVGNRSRHRNLNLQLLGATRPTAWHIAAVAQQYSCQDL